MSFVPVDQAARERARHDHDTSLVIEAGAGTGKTTLLVDRIETTKDLTADDEKALAAAIEDFKKNGAY